MLNHSVISWYFISLEISPLAFILLHLGAKNLTGVLGMI